jgi:hypothetical protein
VLRETMLLMRWGTIMGIVDSWIWHVRVSIGWRGMRVLWYKIGACSSWCISGRRARSRLGLRRMLSLLRVCGKTPFGIGGEADGV